jgi:hypothetical protein
MTNDSALRPHRGILVLVLGIVSLICTCFPVGIIAWVLANQDLKEMNAGIMDPTGIGMTKAGKILAMVSIGISILMAIFYALVIVGAVAMPVMMQQGSGH